MEGDMKLLKIGEKLINWDLVTDLKIRQDRRGWASISIYFGTHRVQLSGLEAEGFERWLKKNHEIETIEAHQPTTLDRAR
jgi:hypothetical protein